MRNVLLGVLLGAGLTGCVPLVDGEGRTVPIVIQPAPVSTSAPVVVQKIPTSERSPIIIGQPVIITQPTAKDDTVHVCTLKPFIDTFRAENTNRGRAMLEVQKQCSARYNGEMFCAKKDIKCSEYK